LQSFYVTISTVIYIGFPDGLMPTLFEDYIIGNDAEEVHNLIVGKRPLPIEIRNKASQSGLMVAASQNALHVLQELLENNADR
jgi:hypothetical protein